MYDKCSLLKALYLLLRSAQNELTINRLDSKKDDCSKPTTDTPKKIMDFYSDIMGHLVSFCNHETLLNYTNLGYG